MAAAVLTTFPACATVVMLSGRLLMSSFSIYFL